MSGLSKKKDLSPSSVKNVNLRPQANPGHRRAWLRPQETGANQVELRRGGVFGLDLNKVRANQMEELPIHQTEVEGHHPILGPDGALSGMEPMLCEQSPYR